RPGPPRFARAEEAAAHHPDPLAVLQERPAVSGLRHAGRRPAGAMVAAIFLEAHRYGMALATLHRVAGFSHRSSGRELLAARDRAGFAYPRGALSRGHDSSVAQSRPCGHGRWTLVGRPPVGLRAGAVRELDASARRGTSARHA